MKPNILVIAGHDPSGGAGIHADIEAIQALGGFASTLITGLTVQNSQNVRGFRLTDIDLLQQQADALLDDMDYQAIKIGMTGSVAILEFIVCLLKRLPGVPVILDPVLAAEAGGSLAQESLAEAMLEKLAPLCDVMTPNLPEAQALSGQTDVADCGRTLVQRSGCATLVTGTHDDTDQVINHLFTDVGEEQWRWDRLPHSYHGSGCTLASSIACLRGHGQSLDSAVANGQAHVDRFLRGAFQPGQGQYVPNRQA